MPNNNVTGALKVCVGITTTVPHTYIYIYLLISKLYRLTSEVDAYLPLFYRVLLSDVDCRVELICHVVTRLPFGRER